MKVYLYKPDGLEKEEVADKDLEKDKNEFLEKTPVGSTTQGEVRPSTPQTVPEEGCSFFSSL